MGIFDSQSANPDGFDHLKASFASDNNANGNGKLTLKWEDLTGGGDKDFDDVVFTATGFKAAGSTTPSTALFTYDADATDADGDTITYSLTTAPQGATINAQTGVITWNASAAGSYNFNVLASDGKGASTVQAFTLTVKTATPVPVNTAPVAKADSFALDEDTTARINVLANDTDAEGNPLTATVVTGPLHGTLVKNADGSFNYTPHKDWYGTDSFTYLANDGKANSNLATVTLTVKPVNDAPVANNASYTVSKDGSIKIDLRGLTSDVDGDCLTLCVNNPSKGTLTKNADSTYTYRPRPGYTGADSFSYTVSDGKLTSTGTISLNVRASQRDDDEDDDHCHGRNGNTSGNRSASVTVTSSASNSTNRSNEDDRDIHYVVINSANSQSAGQGAKLASASSTSSNSNSASASNALAVNWQAGSTSQTIAASPSSQGQSWLSQLLSTDSKDSKNDLSQKTGL